MKIGARFNEMRINKGMTRQEFAKLMGVDPSRVAAFETDRYDSQLSSIEKFADALGYEVKIKLVPKRKVKHAK